MYGLLLKSILSYMQEKHSEISQEVLDELDFLEDGQVDHQQIYSDKTLPRIAKLLSQRINCTEDELLEKFGHFFVNSVVRMGYDDLLFSLGRTLSDFINELDNLHEYIRFTYPKLKAPSFMCISENADSIQLMYRSRRRGFSCYVKGVLRAVASRYCNTEIAIEVLSSKQDGEVIEVIYQLTFDNARREDSAKQQQDVILKDNYFKNKVIMADTVFELYPFHVLFNESMEIMSMGKSLKQLYTKVLREDFASLFDIQRPDIQASFIAISNHTNNIFELKCLLKVQSSIAQNDIVGEIVNDTDGIAGGSQAATKNELVLKGQMMLIDDWSCIMFVGFPLLMLPEQMLDVGLYLSDLSLFDSSRDLVMATAQEAADRQLTQKLLTTKANIVAEASAMADKAREDWQRTHYALLPPSIAKRMMQSEPAHSLSSIIERATVVTLEIVDDTLHSGDKELFAFIEKIHAEAALLCSKWKLFKVDGRLTEFIILAGVPDAIEQCELSALRATLTLTSQFSIKAGIATGQVAAGVVGYKLMAYVPFGPAVQLSRKLMLSSSMKCALADEATTAACVSNAIDIISNDGPAVTDGQTVYKTAWLRKAAKKT